MRKRGFCSQSVRNLELRGITVTRTRLAPLRVLTRPMGSGMVIVFPTSVGEIPGGKPIILAASEIENVIALPTSAGDTPGGTPMIFTTSTRGMVEGAGGTSGAGSVAGAFGRLMVAACAWAGGGNETPFSPLSGTGGLEAVSRVTFAWRGSKGITITFIRRDPLTAPRNA